MKGYPVLVIAGCGRYPVLSGWRRGGETGRKGEEVGVPCPDPGQACWLG